MINQALADLGERLLDGDIVVVAQKVVSKAEGRVMHLSEIVPSSAAQKIAETQKKDPRLVELILRESKHVIALTNSLIISETFHGWVCANAGIDLSNSEHETAVLLPSNPDGSASSLRSGLTRVSGAQVAVIISDTFGRPFRNGQTNVAIGISGIQAIKSYIGTKDLYGNVLRVTEIAIADELAGAAELVMEKANSAPAAVVRGYRFESDLGGTASDLARNSEQDIFRREIRAI